MRHFWNFIWAAFCLACALSLIAVLGSSAGYVSAKIEREARCLNSACADPCKPGARFVRHAGCLK